ncbi:phosphatidate phosphatase LPIN2 isoform X2 [Camponotus floridanus]|uniref:phosphatidate phosphatase LPIN2 isoform X2 n=1 Tax=Camponotus floridanus TaxID=104421 RepID=UPI00059C4052|nr:phosphatidate phosphatase LPIN2 isoform X2 [Camponotus floridanus]
MYSMNYIAKIISNFRLFYNEINAATLTGAIDVIVIEQPDGTFTCSPFHVRFGKLGVLRSRAKVVDIEINGEPREIHMKLGDSGEAFFVEEVSLNGSPTDTEIPPHLACSPIPDDNCFPTAKFNLLSDLPQEQKEKILIDSVLSIEREKWEQMSALPPDQREKFLIEQFSDLPAEHREKWLQIASLTVEERDEMFKESFGTISPEQKQRMIREQYSALKMEDKEKLFKENFPELSIEQRQNFEKALLSDWKEKEENWEEKHDKNEDEEIFDMDAINDEQPKLPVSCPKSFIAVTSSERIRKISVVNNDFRPIMDDPQSSSKEKSSDESNSSLNKKNLKEENIEEVKSNNSTKRKRKRKSVMKKKGSQRKTSNGSSSQTEMSETDVLVTEESISETGPTPVAEVEKNNTVESMICSQDAIEKRPETDFHFFSDSEITKNKDSRSCSPIQSDTEFEVRKITQEGSEREDDKGHQQSWRWGELPSPPPEPVHMSHRNSLSSSTTASQPNNGKVVDEEDTESGNGPSLPQSPNSVEGAIGGPKSLDSDFEEPKHSIFDNNIEISMSLCGGLDNENGPSKEGFHENLLHFEDVCTDPKLYENPNLVVRINGKFYNWATACPIVLTYVVFQRHLPQRAIESLYMSLPVHEDKKLQSNGKPESRSGYSSWFSWRRSTQPPKKTQDINQIEESAVQSEQILETKVADEEILSANREEKTEQHIDLPSSTEAIETCTRLISSPNETVLAKTEKTREGEGEGYSGGEDSDSNHNEPPGIKIPIERRPYYESTEKYRKTLRLSSEQIASLDLKDGANEVVFSVTTAYQGTKRCKCHIYKWKWDDKIVISDIDGTITKSDVLGHILPIVGKDWAQSGVAQLFTKIKNNSYKLLYLSARAIGQAGGTREYLRNLRQGDLTLPEGPLLLNPTSLILAFHREVIEKKPEEFKISCLKDIQALFPEGSEPFYAGYGNRINDVWAYRAVGIPIMRIFTINHRGELKHELTQTFQSSYSNMSFIVDHVFPAWREDATEEFSNFVYWRDPIPEVPKLEEFYAQAQTT